MNNKKKNEIISNFLSPIVYHGTFAEFDKFDKSYLGTSTGSPSAFEGFFFASNKNVAISYASRQVEDIKNAYSKKELLEEELTELTGDNLLTSSLKVYRKEYDKEIDEKALKLIELIQDYDSLLQGIEEMGAYEENELAESGILKAVLCI